MCNFLYMDTCIQIYTCTQGTEVGFRVFAHNFTSHQKISAVSPKELNSNSCFLHKINLWVQGRNARKQHFMTKQYINVYDSWS